MRRDNSHLCGAIPTVRWNARWKMTCRQAALPRYIRERHTTKLALIILRASLLPWREPTGGNRDTVACSIGLSDGIRPQRDVVDK